MTEEEIITALAVTGGSSDDGKQFKELLNHSLAVGIEVKEVIADTAYSGRDNLAEMKSKEIRPVVPLNPVVHNGGQKQEGLEYNKDADSSFALQENTVSVKPYKEAKRAEIVDHLCSTSIQRNARYAHSEKVV